MARDVLKDRFEEAFGSVSLSGEDAAALKLRTQLLLAVKDTIKKRRWSQASAAEALGVRQPRIAEIRRLRIDKFSVELLTRYLSRLGLDVCVRIQTRARR